MTLTIFNKWAICIMFGSWGRYALIPSIEYTKLSNRMLFGFWKWYMAIFIGKIMEGGAE